MSAAFSYQPLRRINPEVIKHLTRHHPDRDLVNFVVDGFTHGFDIGVQNGPAPNKPCKNGSKVLRYPEVAQQLVDEEVQKGHILGPFDTPPIPGLVYSPINLVAKAGSKGSWCLIQDLSHPWDGVNAVNDAIPDSYSKVKYRQIDEVIDIALRIGPQTPGSRIDIRHAFRNLGISERSLKFLAFTLNGKIYLNSSVPFGSASSCFVFEKCSEIIQWIVTNETLRDKISHFLDDFPLLGRSVEDTRIFMTQFIHIVTTIGYAYA